MRGIAGSARIITWMRDVDIILEEDGDPLAHEGEEATAAAGDISARGGSQEPSSPIGRCVDFS